MGTEPLTLRLTRVMRTLRRQTVSAMTKLRRLAAVPSMQRQVTLPEGPMIAETAYFQIGQLTAKLGGGLCHLPLPHLAPFREGHPRRRHGVARTHAAQRGPASRETVERLLAISAEAKCNAASAMLLDDRQTHLGTDPPGCLRL